MLNLDGVNPDYPIPDYVFAGQVVYAPYGDKCLRCVVVAPHGDHARVVNEKYNYDRLISRYHLRIKRGDPDGVME